MADSPASPAMHAPCRSQLAGDGAAEEASAHIASKLPPTTQRFHAGRAVSRADLLWLLKEKPAFDLAQVASLFGYERSEQPAEARNQPGENEPPEAPEAGLGASFGEQDAASVPEASPLALRGLARYFVVAERERFIADDAQPDLPEWLRNAQVLEDDHRQTDAVLPQPLPLVRASRLQPFLRRQLSLAWPGREPDLRRILDAITRGKTLRSLPLKERRGYAARICILLDIQPETWPYRGDFNQLWQQLSRLRGQTGVDVRVLDGHAQDRPRWSRPEGGPSHSWHMPAPSVPLLILSDLGCNRSDPLAQHGWAVFGRHLKVAGIRPLVLCPAPAWRHPSSLQPLFDIVSWDETARRLRPSRPGSEAVPLDRKSAVSTLLALASLAIQVEPALLRALRHLLPAADAKSADAADALAVAICHAQHRQARLLGVLA